MRFGATRIALIVFAVAMLAWWWWRSGGVLVSIENRHAAALENVVLRATGATRSLGNIAPGSVVSTRIRATSDSDLKIELTDSTGRRETLTVDCYLARHSKGRLDLRVTAAGVETVNDQIR